MFWIIHIIYATYSGLSRTDVLLDQRTRLGEPQLFATATQHHDQILVLSQGLVARHQAVTRILGLAGLTSDEPRLRQQHMRVLPFLLPDFDLSADGCLHLSCVGLGAHDGYAFGMAKHSLGEKGLILNV